MRNMLTNNKTVFLEATNKGSFRWKNVIEEIREVGRQVKQRKWGEMVTEMDETYVILLVFLYSRWKVIIPMVKTPAVSRSMGRMVWWKKIFAKEKRRINEKIGFWGGGNYADAKTVMAAFQRMGHSVSMERAIELVEFMAEHGI